MNGEELVLAQPVPVAEFYENCTALQSALHAAKVYCSKRGSFHVHIGAESLSGGDVYRICALYRHFQKQLDLLVGKSRRSDAPHGTAPNITYGNGYCAPFNSFPSSAEEFIKRYKLEELAGDRLEARSHRNRNVVNVALMRARNPMERSIEYRQGSVSTKAEVLHGWVMVLVAITWVGQQADIFDRIMAERRPATWRRFKMMLRIFEKKTACANLQQWVDWRNNYLNSSPNEKFDRTVLDICSSRPKGLFSICRKTGLNHAQALTVVTRLVEVGSLIHITDTTYKTRPSQTASADLASVVRVWEAAEPPSVVHT